MNHIEIEGYYATLNLIIELFEKMELPKDHFSRIYKLSDLIDSAYNGNIPIEFIRNDNEIITEEEFYRGMLLDDSGKLIIDNEGNCIPDPNYSILKKRSNPRKKAV